MASPDPAPCPEERTNFFRVCRIVLDHIPEVLRVIFKTEVKDRHGHTWNDTTTSGKWLVNVPGLTSGLRAEQKQLLEDGRTDKWDPTLLFHVLKSSTLCLLRVEIPGATLHQNGLEVSVPAGGTVPTSIHRITIVSGKTTVFGEVSRVSPTQIFLKKKVTVNPNGAKIYYCAPQFEAVDRLRELRNVFFGHVASATTPTADLDNLLSKVEQAYRDLSCPEADIQSLTEIRREGIINNVTFAAYQRRMEYFYQQSLEYDQRIRGLEDRVEGLELKHEASARQTESNTRMIGDLQDEMKTHGQGSKVVSQTQLMISQANIVNVYNVSTQPPPVPAQDHSCVSPAGSISAARGGGPSSLAPLTTPAMPLGSQVSTALSQVMYHPEVADKPVYPPGVASSGLAGRSSIRGLEAGHYRGLLNGMHQTGQITKPDFRTIDRRDGVTLFGFIGEVTFTRLPNGKEVTYQSPREESSKALAQEKAAEQAWRSTTQSATMRVTPTQHQSPLPTKSSSLPVASPPAPSAPLASSPAMTGSPGQKTSVSRLKEYCDKQRYGDPDYTELPVSGEEGFQYRVTVRKMPQPVIAEGEVRPNKREAKQSAAQKALKKLGL